MKRALTCASLALGLVALAAIPAHADETTFCNAYITTLPYTINTQGHYCFDRNLSTAITTGNAITINSDFVVVDLNNFKLGGGSAGLATNTNGIYAINHRNITIRNGNIRGFKYGIQIQYSSIALSGGHLIENNVLDGNTYTAIYVIGDTQVVRNNTILNTGGSSSNPSNVTGIYTNNYGASGITQTRDNIIANTFNSGTGYHARGVYFSFGDNDHNLIRSGSVSHGYAYGFYSFWGGWCRDNTVIFNSSGRAYSGCNLIGPSGSNYTTNP